MDYGITLNTSYVKNDDGVHAAAHIKSSDGLDIDTQVSGEDTREVLEALIDEITDGMIKEYLGDGAEEEETTEEVSQDELMKYIDELERENRSLKSRLHKSDRKSNISRKDLFAYDPFDVFYKVFPFQLTG